MRLSESDRQELAELAVRAAVEAGEMIAESRPTEVENKAGGASLASQVVTEVDRRSEAIILEHLAPTLGRFELALLTEERDDDGGRLVADHFWCIDPLDGTLPFVEGVPGYAVSIALVGRDGTPWIGAIHDPVEATTFHAIRGAGAFRNGQPWSNQGPASRVLTVFADRSFVDADNHGSLLAQLQRIARDLGLDGVEVQVGRGAVMNACGVLAKAPACYVKFPKPTGGGSVWDFAATACLFHEVGAIVTDVRGKPLDLNRADSTSMNHRGVLFATDAEVARRLIDGVAS